jgi:hypothetical protein
VVALLYLNKRAQQSGKNLRVEMVFADEREASAVPQHGGTEEFWVLKLRRRRDKYGSVADGRVHRGARGVKGVKCGGSAEPTTTEYGE